MDLIALDADDTLWHSEIFYAQSQQRFAGMMTGYGFSDEHALAILHECEMMNLPYFGYGIKGFILSMVDAASALAGDKLRAEDTRAIVEMGRWMAGHKVELLEHVQETVALLAQTRDLILITKGDLMDQQRKIAESGLSRYFIAVEIVSDKTHAVYAELLEKHRVAPEHFLMVGNSLRSDVLPVLEMGGYAVFVPYPLTWSHELNVKLPAADGRYFQISNLGELPHLLAQIETV